MTPQEYCKLTEWFLDGSAQYKTSPYREWTELRSLDAYKYITPTDFTTYRRRPDTKPLPDEVWVAPENPERHMVVLYNRMLDGMTRYVRADAVIDGERMEFCPKCDNREPRVWGTLNNCLIRFKP